MHYKSQTELILELFMRVPRAWNAGSTSSSLTMLQLIFPCDPHIRHKSIYRGDQDKKKAKHEYLFVINEGCS